jgi:hypothetical protein
VKAFLLSILFVSSAMAFNPIVKVEFEVESANQSDILFVIDDSGSMQAHQNALANISNVFISELNDIDFKITGFNTTQDSDFSNYLITRHLQEPTNVLQEMISSFGVNGSASEVPFQRVMDFSHSETGKMFFRDSSTKEVIILSDEDDQTRLPLEDIDSFITSHKLTVSAVTTIYQNSNCGFSSSDDRTINIVQSSGGSLIDICEEDESVYKNEYQKLAMEISKRAKKNSPARMPIKSFKLNRDVDLDSIKVYFGSQILKKGHVNTGWVIDENNESLLFGDRIKLSQQPLNTKLTIEYKLL